MRFANGMIIANKRAFQHRRLKLTFKGESHALDNSCDPARALAAGIHRARRRWIDSLAVSGRADSVHHQYRVGSPSSLGSGFRLPPTQIVFKGLDPESGH